MPLGPEAASVVVTRWLATSGKPGSRMRVDYQLASKSPIVEIGVKLNAVPVAIVSGENLTSSAGTWFTAPAVGSYKLAVAVRNAFGCTREAVAPFNVVVK